MKIKHAILTGLAMVLVTIIFTGKAKAASCIEGPWVSTHKTLHFVGTAATSATVTAITKNPYYGFMSGMFVGAVREMHKVHTPGMRCEWASITYDTVGSLAGSGAVQHWYIAPMQKGVEVGYHKDF